MPVFAGNIAPFDCVTIYIYIKDHLDISNVRINATGKSLTHCRLVTPYGNRDLGQHWLM